MATADEFRRSLLNGLLSDAQKGRGTDLEVIVPDATLGENNDDEGRRTSFHLHHTIVATSSHYFATFPDPKTGRVIEDLEAEAFSICIRFMYTGEYHESLSHDNVSSVLHAAELLQIDTLKEKCIDFLGQNLDHTNHMEVAELADHFNIPRLKESATRFKSKNSGRDALLAKKESLMRKIDITKYEENQISERRKGLQKQLENAEDQLKDVFMEQHEKMLVSSWENELQLEDKEDQLKEVLMEQHEELLLDSWKFGDDMVPSNEGGYASSTPPFLFGTSKKSGSVGHLVHTLESGAGYEGSSTYGDKVYDSDDSEYDPYGNHPPPPPTEAQYEALGIVKSHESLKVAVENAKPGDRIYSYLGQGVHYSSQSPYDEKKIEVCKSLEFIGLGNPNDVVFQIDCDDDKEDDQRCISVLDGTVGIYNITFKESRKRGRNEKSCNYAQGTGDNAMIRFEACEDSKLIVKNCVFELGMDCESAYPTRVSGVFLKKGKMATIEGCKFLGGAGSAIVAVNDPYLYIPDIEIRRNNFVSNGQPTFCEKASDELFRGNKLEFVPIPSEKITPGPGSVELWRFNRKCYRERGIKEEHKTLSINMTENKFSHNLRAPFSYRAVVPKSESKVTNDWKLHSELSSGDNLSKLVQGFNVLLKGNVMENNGLQFSKDAISKMRDYTVDQKKMGICTEDRECTFPDGDSLLVIQHCMSKFDEDSFPESWGEGYPYDGYWDDVDSCHSSDAEYFDDNYESDYDSDYEIGPYYDDGW